VPSTTTENPYRTLRRLAQSKSATLTGKRGKSIPLPPQVRILLAEIARNLEAGKSVAIVPDHQELTTQRAANLLGVSRPFLVKLLEDGKLAFHRTGAHRRVYLADVIEYRDRRDAARHAAIRQLAREDVAAGSYDKVILPKAARSVRR
jgi:excisionase family DNA binding protein